MKKKVCKEKKIVFIWLIFVDRLNSRNLLRKSNYKIGGNYNCVLGSLNTEETTCHLFHCLLNLHSVKDAGTHRYILEPFSQLFQHIFRRSSQSHRWKSGSKEVLSYFRMSLSVSLVKILETKLCRHCKAPPV
jgi:hypothetical protein